MFKKIQVFTISIIILILLLVFTLLFTISIIINNNNSSINNFRYADDTSLMVESREELKSLLIRVKVASEKAGLNSAFKKLRS